VKGKNQSSESFVAFRYPIESNPTPHSCALPLSKFFLAASLRLVVDALSWMILMDKSEFFHTMSQEDGYTSMFMGWTSPDVSGSKYPIDGSCANWNISDPKQGK
jgi:hypothetical protein